MFAEWAPQEIRTLVGLLTPERFNLTHVTQKHAEEEVGSSPATRLEPCDIPHH